jgi:hypothetical protein
MNRELYEAFKGYLTSLVHQSEISSHITLHTAIPDEPVYTILTTYRPDDETPRRDLEIKVLTPSFYSRFMHYAYTSEAFDRECIFTHEKNRTLWISRPELLPLLINKPSSSNGLQWSVVERGYLEELRWTVLKTLRCAPALPAHDASTPSKSGTATEDVRSLPYSELDQYVRSLHGRAWAGQYRKTVTKLFLTERFGLGFAEVIGLLDLALRFLLCCLGAFHVIALWTRSEQAKVGSCSMGSAMNGTTSICLKDVTATHGDWWWLFGSVVSISACHLYGMLKGYC